MGPRALLSGDRELLKTHESNLPTCGRTSGNLRVQKTRSLSSCPSQGTNLASLGSRTHPWPGAPESLFLVTVVVGGGPLQGGSSPDSPCPPGQTEVGTGGNWRVPVSISCPGGGEVAYSEEGSGARHLGHSHSAA